MKKGISILLALLLTALLSVSVAAQSLPIESYLTYEITDGTVTITDCVESFSGTLTIPAEIEGNPVTAIGKTAFYGCQSLAAVVIPEGVTAIGDQAFGNCTHLSEVTIPASVTAIGFDAFENTAIYNNTAKWDEGMVYAADGEVVRGKGLLYIGDCLVAANPDLSRGVIKEGTRLVADYVFFACGAKEVSIPTSLKVVGKQAFEQCDALTTVHYGGTETAWDEITIGEGNEALTEATKSYESQLTAVDPEKKADPAPKKKPVNLWRIISIASAVVAVVTGVLGAIAYWPKKKEAEDTEESPAEETAPKSKTKAPKKKKK